MMRKIKQILGVALIHTTIVCAQPWQTGGNNFGLNPATNFFGSQAPNNTWLRMGVNGSQDIFIDNNPAQLYTGSAASGAFNQGGHWIGLGRVFTPQLGPGAFPIFAPKAHLHIHGNNNYRVIRFYWRNKKLV